MLRAWDFATHRAAKGSRIQVVDILNIGMLVEPEVNKNGFRTVPVTIRGVTQVEASLVPHSIENLVRHQDDMPPEYFYHEFETVHPFADGNGRTGKILFNWLRNEMWGVEWPPSYWGKDENP